jgi:hypothetical protein
LDACSAGGSGFLLLLLLLVLLTTECNDGKDDDVDNDVDTEWTTGADATLPLLLVLLASTVAPPRTDMVTLLFVSVTGLLIWILLLSMGDGTIEPALCS